MSLEFYEPRPETLPGRCIAYFRRLPDEELSIDDIALKFDTNPNSVHSALKLAVEHNRLQRDGRVYSAGKDIGTAPDDGLKLGEMKPGKPARNVFVVNRPALDLEALTVEDDIPCPTKSIRGASKWDPLFAKLKEAGQSIAVPLDAKSALMAEVMKRNKLKAGSYRVFKISETQARVWRTT